LDDRLPLLDIDRENSIDVFGKIDENSNIAALARQTGSSAAQHNGRIELTAEVNSHKHVVDASGDDDPNWNLPVTRCISGVQRTAAAVKTDLTIDCSFEGCCEPARVGGGPLLMFSDRPTAGCPLNLVRRMVARSAIDIDDVTHAV